MNVRNACAGRCASRFSKDNMPDVRIQPDAGAEGSSVTAISDVPVQELSNQEIHAREMVFLNYPPGVNGILWHDNVMKIRTIRIITVHRASTRIGGYFPLLEECGVTKG